MQTIWTTPVRYSDVHLFGALGRYARYGALGLIAAGVVVATGCVFDAGGANTTAVALDTGAGSTGPGSSTSGLETTAADASDGSSSGDAESSSGEPPNPDTSSSTGAASSEGGEEPCGNGKVDPGEDCDGELLVAESCAELDPIYTEGTPTCDGACKLDTSPCCEAPILKPCDDASDYPLHALELGCDDVKGWSAADSVPLTTKAFNSLDPSAYRVLRRFGSHPSAWGPRAGARALLLGTGKFAPADGDGVVTANPGTAQYGGNNLNPDSLGMLPEGFPVHTVDGGSEPFVNCDGTNDCSNTLADQWNALSPKDAKDIVWFNVETVVPPGTHGYALDLAFFTAHYPEYNNYTYNDMVVLWSQSEAYVGNVSFRRDGDKVGPLSLPELFEAKWMTHDGKSDPALVGTGYDGVPTAEGGASEWLTIEGPAVPGESLTLTLALMDLEDSALDSAILVDNFRWSCTGCDLATDCGVRLADAP